MNKNGFILNCIERNVWFGHFLVFVKHAWNIVYVEHDYYYVDYDYNLIQF